MFKKFLKVMMLLTVIFQVFSVSSASAAPLKGLSSKLANEVKMSLWNGGVESEFKDAMAFYLELMENDQAADQVANHAIAELDEAVSINQMPEELLIPLMNL